MNQFPGATPTTTLPAARPSRRCRSGWWIRSGRLIRTHGGQTIVCVSHGVAIRTAMAAFYGYSLAQLDRILPSDNTGVSCVEVENGQPHVRVYADGSHLGEELSTLGKQTWWREQEAATPLEDQNVWYRAWDPVGERALYYRCRQEAWISVHGTDIPFPGEQFYEAARTASERNVASVMVAMVGDEVAGLLQMDLERYQEEQAGYIPFYYMNPGFRKRGLGIQLIGQAVSTFRPLGRDKLRLRCSPDQRGGPAVLRPQRVSLYWPGNGQRSAPGAAGKVHRLRGMSGKRKTAPAAPFCRCPGRTWRTGGGAGTTS